MKSLLKPIILSTALSLISLCFTISYASNIHVINLNKPVATSQVYVYAFSLLDSEGSQLIGGNLVMNSNTKPINGHTNSIAGLLHNPLLMIGHHSTLAAEVSQESRSSSFYEMTAIFNDKLQTFLSYFYEPKKVKHVNELANATSTVLSDCKG